MKRRRRRMSTSNRLGMVMISFIVIVLLIVLLVKSQQLRDHNARLETRMTELNELLHEEELRADEIENLEEYVETPEFAEKAAREKLGMVYEDEIIYVPEE